MARILTSLLLAVVLVLTSQQSVVARGMDRAVDHMVICAGTETVVVYIDAEGAPTAAPHHCPDCALLGFVATVPPDVILGTRMARGAAHVLRERQAASGASRPHVQARAPPVSI
ncbi:MAG: hypothetical protein AAFQ19_09600 [Pseudomonadota bacterium]